MYLSKLATTSSSCLRGDLLGPETSGLRRTDLGCGGRSG